jgi:hypothetical protein
MTYSLPILRKVGLVVAVFWVTGCPIKTTSPTYTTPSDLSPAGRVRLATYCDKRTMCSVDQGVTIGACPTSMCLSRVYEEAPLLQFLDCQIAKQCSAFFNDDDCFLLAGTSDAERDAFTARCAAKSTECTDDFGDACAIGAPIVRKEFMRAVDACLSRATCADVKTCISAIAIEDCWP